jgi:hypothetical protein
MALEESSSAQRPNGAEIIPKQNKFTEQPSRLVTLNADLRTGK